MYLLFSNILQKGRVHGETQVYYRALFEHFQNDITAGFAIVLTKDDWSRFHKAMKHRSNFQAKNKFCEITISLHPEQNVYIHIQNVVASFDTDTEKTTTSFKGLLTLQEKLVFWEAATMVENAD